MLKPVPLSRALPPAFAGTLLAAAFPTTPAEAVDIGSSLRMGGHFEAIVREEGGNALARNNNNHNDNPFNYFHLYLKGDAVVSEHAAVFTRLHFDDGSLFEVSLDGAYVQFQDFVDTDLYVQLGKIPSPFGAFAERSCPHRNPLIGTPLLFYYHSNLRGDMVPMSTDELLATKGRGQLGFSSYNAPAGPGRKGLPIVYDPCWDYGLVLLGTWKKLEYRLGVVNGTTSAPETDQDSNDSRSPIARLGVVPFPWLRVGVSAARGHYLDGDVGAFLPAGKDVRDYPQTTLGADLELSSGYWELRGECASNTFESPYVDEDLTMWSYYLELRRKLGPGLYAAMRWDELGHNEIENSSGEKVEWENGVRRVEAGLGYWPEPDVLFKADLQANNQAERGWKREEMIGGVQVILWF